MVEGDVDKLGQVITLFSYMGLVTSEVYRGVGGSVTVGRTDRLLPGYGEV